MRFFKTAAALCVCLALLAGCAGAGQSASSKPDFTAVPGPGSASQTQQPVDVSSLRYRAMWVSYLEWKNLNTSNSETFTQDVAALMENCKNLGVNCVIVQVRPFSDAIYSSEYFPWSHVVKGEQGRDPGFDPLQIFVEEAHASGLAIEAWINPYRVRLNDQMPGALADQNPALTHEGWAVEANNGLYFDPALPEVRQYIIDGTLEVVNKYAVDGVQFDDYFYPTTDASFDAGSYEKYGAGQDLAAWRRENVNTLVRDVYSAIKAARPAVQFGISPQGNNDQNYNVQYSDVALWMKTPGYVDYVMPQVYWGYGYTLQNGSQQFAFENVVNAWAELPRDASVALAFGLGTYRIGAGDGGANDQTQWSSGGNLAAMLQTLAKTQGVQGYGLYRYDNLFHNDTYDALAKSECDALRKTLPLA